MHSEPRLLHLWGKLGAGDAYHPALFHMLDVGNVAQTLLAPEAAPRWLSLLKRPFGAADDEQIRRCIPLLVAMHDLGKLSAGFQGQTHPPQRAAHRERLERVGYRFPDGVESNTPHHTAIGAVFTKRGWPPIEEGAPPPASLVSVLVDAI